MHELSINTSLLYSNYKICDQVWENRSYPHILYFEKYLFEIVNALYLSCGTIQSRQMYYNNSIVSVSHLLSPCTSFRQNYTQLSPPTDYVVLL